jgi:hypothetical protein
MNLREALSQLDPENDDHWTSNGDPLIDVVTAKMGTKVTREEIVNSAPKFSRSNFVIPEMPSAPEPTKSDDVYDVPGESEPITDEHLALRNRSKALNAESGQLRDQIEGCKKRQGEIQNEMIVLEQKLAGYQTHQTNQQSIQAYIKSQNKIRIERAMARQELLKRVDPNALAGSAPIDQAFARKTKRGMQRPQMPVKTV